MMHQDTGRLWAAVRGHLTALKPDAGRPRLALVVAPLLGLLLWTVIVFGILALL